MKEGIRGCICPYYKDETNWKIICEGIVQNSEMQTGFASPKAKSLHKKTFCAGCFFRCPNAIMLNGQWNRYNVVRCKWNKGVECANTARCARCGWNPVVAQDRINRTFPSFENPMQACADNTDP